MNSSLYESLQNQLSNVHIYQDYWMCSCPFHGRDEHPSMMVHKDAFHCMSCGKSGTLEYLARTIHLKGYKVQVTRSQPVLPRWRRWEQTYGDLTGIARAAHAAVRKYSGYDFYFKKRKIDQFIDAGMFGCLEGWCTFPVFDEYRNVIDMVVRGTKGQWDTRYVLHPDKQRLAPPLYVPDWLRVMGQETVYVTYGILDAWAIYACGLAAVTGTTGKSLSAAQLKPLGKRFIILPDKYEEREAYLLAAELGWRAKVKLLNYDNDCKDPDDERRNFNVNRLLELLTPSLVSL